MKILLDTHIFLWWLEDNPKLSKKAKDLIANPENIIFLSSASIWEISIKKTIGKLKADFVAEEEILINSFIPLPISIKHAAYVSELPLHHTDPFDRMLISQAIVEDCYILSHDKNLKSYKAKVLLT